MRTKLVNPKTHLLRYGIREIVDVAQKLKEFDPSMTLVMENIGDPIMKSWLVPNFLKEAIVNEVNKPGDAVFGYAHSRGLIETRKWVVDYAKRFSPTSELNYENVLFTNGLGASISAFYQMLPAGARILQPTPSYPTHTSFESFAANAEPVLYKLDPDNSWQPDMADLEAQIIAHPDVAAILIINPNNPTGAVYSKETLEKMVDLAEKYKLFIISDEVYFRMVYNNAVFTQITDIAHNRVPLVVMRGLSKDIPWPGGRCGWMEFHNVDLDPEFKSFVDGVKQRILLEICSGTLPQKILPTLYEHPEFETWNKQYNAELEKNANYIHEVLSKTKGLKVNKIYGAFYMMPLFETGALNDKQTLPIANDAARAYIESVVNQPGFPLDKRFCYYLLAATGICVVPSSGFFSPYPGFRLTTLDRDETRRQDTYARLSKAVEDYLASAA
ncbi:MAG: pyridoxal phosphate-dependent aminotransferase [Candidatus Gracilibacteria bacterium]